MAYALFLSTPSARRATYDDDHVPTQDTISIHALREEGDCHTDNCCLVDAISIHALREEGDCTAFSTNSSSRLFLSTPSARRATRHCPMWTLLRVFLSTPSARRATRSSEVIDDVSVISIHALREEGDTRRHQNDSDRHGFLSTPSARRATLAEARQATFYNAFLSTPSARRATAKTETKSLFSNKLYNILHEFRRALIYNGSKNYPNHAK